MPGPANRTTVLVWAAIAEVSLGGLVVALLTAFDGDDSVPFGVPGALILLVAAMAVTAVGAAIASAARGAPAAVRYTVAPLLAIAAGLTAALAIACFLSSNGSVAGLGIPLLLAVVGMNVVTTRAAANKSQGVS
jgi:hypothetical protein